MSELCLLLVSKQVASFLQVHHPLIVHKMNPMARLEGWTYLTHDQQHHLQCVLRQINKFQFEGKEIVKLIIENAQAAINRLDVQREAVNSEEEKLVDSDFLQLIADTLDLNMAIDHLLANAIGMPMLERQANSLIGLMSNIRWFVRLRRPHLLSKSTNLWPPTSDTNHPPLLPANEVERRFGFIFKMLNDVISNCTDVSSIQEKDTAIEVHELLTFAVCMYFRGQFNNAETKLSEVLSKLHHLKSIDEQLTKGQRVARSLAPRLIHQTEKLSTAMKNRFRLMQDSTSLPKVTSKKDKIPGDLIIFNAESHITQQNEFTKDLNFLVYQVYDLKMTASLFASYENHEYTIDLDKCSKDIIKMADLLSKLIESILSNDIEVGSGLYRSSFYKIIYHLTDVIEVTSKSASLPIIRRLQLKLHETLSNIQWFDHCRRPTQVPYTCHLMSPQHQPKTPMKTPAERSIETLLQLAHSISTVSESRLLIDGNRWATCVHSMLTTYDAHYSLRQLTAMRMINKALNQDMIVMGNIPSQVECDGLMSIWYDRMCHLLETLQMQCDAEFSLITSHESRSEPAEVSNKAHKQKNQHEYLDSQGKRSASRTSTEYEK